MDERVRISLWVLCGGGLGAILGGAFGALTGALYAQSGRAAGTGLGRRVADVFTRAGERPASAVQHAALTGAADGFLFLGIMGALTGAGVAIFGAASPRWLAPAALGAALLVGAAAFFGVLAYAMAHNGVRAVLHVFAGGLLGAFLASTLLGADRCLLGAVPGLAAGLTLSFVMRRYAPAFQPPSVGAATPRRRMDSSTDLTRPYHGEQSFRRPDDFEEE
jgi:hypothetical protein